MLKHLLFISQHTQHEQALFDWVLAFAQSQGATVTVLRVLPEPEAGIFLWFENLLPTEVMHRQSKVVLGEFTAWKTQAAKAGVTLTTEVLFGKLFYKAIQYAVKTSVDWIIKQTDEATQGLTANIFNSQDKHLLRKCPCPVLLHKHGTALPFNKIMASIDVDLYAETLAPCDFNQSILKQAIFMAQWQQRIYQNNTYLEVVHAWQADAENLVHYWNPDLSEGDLLKWTENSRQQHLTAIEMELNALNASNIEFETVLPKGAAVEVIPHVVEQHQVDLLVMGTLGREGLPGMIIGNTSESILEQINCSVLALKPRNFVSPISEPL